MILNHINNTAHKRMNLRIHARCDIILGAKIFFRMMQENLSSDGPIILSVGSSCRKLHEGSMVFAPVAGMNGFFTISVETCLLD